MPRGLAKGLNKAVRSITVYLPAAAPAAKRGNTTDGRDDSGKNNADQPIPIGVLIDGWEAAPQWDQAHHRSTTIGISLAAEYQNQGYGSRETINWALEWGFVEEERDREAIWFDRKWYDVIRYSMLEHKWEGLQGVKN